VSTPINEARRLAREGRVLAIGPVGRLANGEWQFLEGPFNPAEALPLLEYAWAVVWADSSFGVLLPDKRIQVLRSVADQMAESQSSPRFVAGFTPPPVDFLEETDEEKPRPMISSRAMRIRQAILDALHHAPEITEREIENAVRGRTRDLRRALRSLLQENAIRRSGQGLKHSPFRYRILGPAANGSGHKARERASDHLPDPNDAEPRDARH
jgi:hypothetical protein